MNKQENEFQTGKASTLEDVFGKEKLYQLQKIIAFSNDISVSIIDYKGNQVLEPIIENPFCLNKQADDSICSMCPLAGAYGAMKAVVTGDNYIFQCKHGMTIIAAPIVVDEQYLGSILAGRVMCEDYMYPETEMNFPQRAEEKKKSVKENTNQAIISVAETEDNRNDESMDALNSIKTCDKHKIAEYSSKRIEAISHMIQFSISQMCEKTEYQSRIKKFEHQKKHLSDLRRRNQEMEKKVEFLEINNMKAEMSPQLLLNMLVTISNSAILENALHTERLIVEQTSILRYYLDQTSEKAALSKEIEQIEHYMESLKLPYGTDNFEYIIKCQEELKAKMFPTLSLFPFAQYLVYKGMFKSRLKGMFFLDVEIINDTFSVIMQFENTQGDKETKTAPQIINGMGNKGSGEMNDVSVELLTNETYMINQIQHAKKRLQYEYGSRVSVEQKQGLVLIKISDSILGDEKGGVQ